MCLKIIFFLRTRFFLLLSFLLIFGELTGQTTYKKVLIETSLGSMTLILYNETPMHSENFIDLVKKGQYEDILFHRVINNFMIQSGDPGTRNSVKGQRVGSGDVAYTIPAEFHPDLYHQKGALAAARQGDAVNPARASSGSQFYIVQGTVFTNDQLNQMEERHSHIRFTDEQRKIYTTVGGTPHLDYSYTVFGRVIDGMETIDKIAAVATDQYDRPVEDIMVKIRILE